MNKKEIVNPLYKYKKLIFIFFIILLLVFTIMSNSEDIQDGFEKMKLIPWGTTIALFGLLVLYIIADTYILKASIDDSILKFSNTFTINMAGSFFSAITPLYIGSYPSRVFYLYKEGIPIDKILSGLTIKGLSYQIVLTFIAIMAFFTTSVVEKSGWQVAFYIGIIFNICLGTFLVLISSSKKFNSYVIRVVQKLSKRFEFFKKREAELMTSINNYYEQTRRMYYDYKYTLKVFAASFIKQIIYYAMPIVIFSGLGMPVQDIWFDIIATAAVIQIMVSVIPTPGGMGTTEYIFIILYGILYSSFATNGEIEAGMLIYRFVTHYSIIIIGLIVTLYLQTKKPKKKV